MLKAAIGAKLENSFCQSVQKEGKREELERQLQSVLHYTQME